GRILLVERLALDAVGIASQNQWTVLQVGQKVRGDGTVISDEVALRVTLLGPEDLVLVRDLHAASNRPLDARLFRQRLLFAGKPAVRRELVATQPDKNRVTQSLGASR